MNLNLKDKIYIGLLNKRKNKNLLNEIIYKDFLDLIMFCYYKDSTENAIRTVKITNGLLEKMNMEKDELFELAMKNTKRDFPIELVNLEDMIEKLTGKKHEMNSGLILARCDIDCYGASAMLFLKDNAKIKRMYRDKICIIPSSIHEVLLVNDSRVEKFEISNVIYEVNKDVVSEEEFLSNNLYELDINTGQIEIVMC